MLANRKRVFLYGFIIWSCWILLYSIVASIQVTQLPFFLALLTSAGQFYLYAFFSIGIWFICRNMPIGRISHLLLVFSHFCLSILCSALWVFIVFAQWYLRQGEKIFTEYHGGEFIGWQFLFGVMIYWIIAGFFYAIIYYKQYREQVLRETSLKLLTRDAEIRALKMQINPHFLFNTLNSINALVTQNAGLARHMIANLSSLFRMSLENRDKKRVPLKEELDFARTFLSIEQIRFQDRMKVQEKIDPDLSGFPFPAMVLQPLLENAVKHGIANIRGTGNIHLLIERQSSGIRCTVRNTIDKLGKLADSAGQANGINGTGLTNIRKRLDLLYGSTYSLETNRVSNHEYLVALTIPESIHDEK